LYEQAASIMYAPQKDPTTGMMVQMKVPAHVQDAFAKRGKTISGGEIVKQGGGLAETNARPQGAEPIPPSETIYGLADLVSGPTASVAGKLASTPIIGDIAGDRLSKYTQAQSKVSTMTRNLVRVLQNNPKFSEGERKAIADDLKLGTDVFDRPGAYRNRIIGIDDALVAQSDVAMKTLSGKGSTLQERRHAMDVLTQVEGFREHLGAPQRMSPEEAAKLPPGTFFRREDTGQLLRTTGGTN